MTTSKFFTKAIIFLSVAFFSLVSANLFAQQFQKTYGGTQDDRAFSVIQTADGGYIASGNTGSSTSTQYLHVVKMDNAFNIQWTFRINANSPNQTGRSIIQTADGGYVIAGNNNGIGASAGTRDFYILKLNSAGTLQWTRVLDENGAGGNNSLYSIQQTADGGFICSGTTDASCGTANIALIKLTSSGTYSWKSNLGACNGSGDSWPARVVIANDGGFVVAGTSNSGSNGGGDLYLLKTNSSGTIQWGTRCGGSSYMDQGFALTKSNDGGYAVAGVTSSFPTAHAGVGKNVYMVKFNSGGTMQWTRTIGGTSSSGSGDNIANSIVQTSDNGYVVAGSTSFYGNGGGIDAYVAKVNSAGSLLWTKTFGGSSTDEMQSVIQNANGDLVMAGYTASYVSPTGQFDWYLLSMKSDGTMCGPNTSSGGFSGSGGTTGSDVATSTITLADRGAAGTVSTYTGTITSKFSVTVSPASAAICSGQNTTLTASGGTNYSWSPSAGLNVTTGATVIANPTVTTTYTVTDGANNCTQPVSAAVTVNSLPTPSISGSPIVCSGGTTLTANGGTTYSWSTGETTASITVTPTVNTTYTVIATNSAGCTGTATFLLRTVTNLGSGNVCTNNVTMTDSVKWFQLVSDSQNLSVFFPSPSVLTGSIYLYGGSCNSLSIISSDAIQQNGNAALFIREGLTPGNTYWIKISATSSPTSISVCKTNYSTLSCAPPPQCNYIYNGSFETGTTPVNTGELFRASCWKIESTNSGTCGVSTAGTNSPDLFDAAVTSPQSTTCSDGNTFVDIPQNFETVNTPVASPASGNRYIGMYKGEKISGLIQTLTNNFYILQFNSNPGDVSCGYLDQVCIDLIKTGVPASGYNICSPCVLKNAGTHQWTTQSYCADFSAVSSIGQYDGIAIKAVTTGSTGPRQESLFDDFVLWKLADAGPDVTTCSCVTIGNNCLTQFANVTYSWSPSTGLSNPNILNPIACPASTTIYTLTAIYTDPNNTSNTCTATDQVTVTVTGQPVAGFTFTNEQCMGNSFSFTNTSSGATIYSWDFGDPTSGSNTSTQTSPSHTYNKPGQYVVILTATNANAGCCDVFSALVSVTPFISGSYNNNPTCCSASFSYASPNVTSITYSTSQNFTGVAFAVRDVMRITNNSTVTFTSSTIEFGPWGKVIVEPGSTLNLVATTFTGLLSCGTMWQGIEVWGDATHSHATFAQQAFQGKLTTSPSGGVTTIIERAHNAITLGRYVDPFLPTLCNQAPPKPCSNGIYNTCSSGGILIATGKGSSNTHEFIENAHNIRVAPFKFPNVSTVTRCLFGGAALRDPGYSTATTAYQYPNGGNKNYAYANPLGRTYRFGYIQNAQWTSTITFFSNRFDLPTDLGAEIGIEITDGKCFILGNTFTNTIRGISGIYTSSSPFLGNRIKGNIFTNPTPQSTNVVTPFPSACIYLKASQGDRISDANKFGDFNLLLAQANTPYGIFMDNSSYFLILDNEFYKAQQGIYVWKSSFNGGVIQRFDSNSPNGNFFKQCKRSILTNEDNSALRIRCNTTDNNNSGDYAFTTGGANWDNSLTTFNTLAQQGAPANSSQITRPAGNRFDVSNLSSSTRKQIKSLFAYKYLSHSTYTYIPVNASSSSHVNIQVQAAQCTNFPACCPSDPCLSENPPYNCNIPHLAQIDNDLSTLRAEYDSTVNILDQGHTTQLLSALDVDTSDSYIQNLLLDNSPLSDEVVEALINWADYASANTFSEIIIPNSPVSDDLRAALLSKLDELPGGVAEAINAAQSSNTYRTLTNINKDIAVSALDRQSALTSILVFYADTDSIQTMTTLLENENTVSADQSLLALYISQDSLTKAATKLSQMTANNEEEEAYLALQGMLLGLAQDSLNIFDIDSTQEALVRNIASMPPSVAQANACAILYIVFNESCIPDSGAARHQNVFVSPDQSMFMENASSMGYLGNNIPNPLNNNTVIPYLLPDGVGQAFIRIYSIAGKLLHSYEINDKHSMLNITSDDLENGVYIYRLETNKQILGSKKMIVIK